MSVPRRVLASLVVTLLACDGRSQKPSPPVAPPVTPLPAPSPTEARLQVECPIEGEVVGAFGEQRVDNFLSLTDLPKTPCKPGTPVVLSLKPGQWALYFHVPGWMPSGQKYAPPFGGCVHHPFDAVAGDRQSWSPSDADLGVCPYITHCPLVAIEGRPLFAVLVDRHDASLAGVDRHALNDLAVVGGAIEMELREIEPEVTHVTGVWLEVDGRSIAVEGPATMTLRQGDHRALRFVAGGADRRLNATLVVRGYYELVEEKTSP